MNFEIQSETNNLNTLKSKFKAIRIPRRSIAFQLQNMRYGSRETLLDAIRKKRLRRNFRNQISGSENRLASLTAAFLAQQEVGGE